ncbi:hypothetical protein F4604DRAFT_2038239, partial [Suillus subluteus]
EETLMLLGTYTPTVLNTILGITLSASKVAHHVFIPHSTPIPILQFALLDVHADSNIYSLPRSPRVRNIHGGAAVAIQSLDTGVEGLGRVCLLLVQPESWSIALSTAETPPSSADPIPLLVYVVKGSKKSGKSTFARTLLNRLLARFQGVAYLECDVGQSEFTPGGLVALNVIDNPVFGLPFTHPSLPYRVHYHAAVQVLLEMYKLNVQTSMPDDESIDTWATDVTPLMINTMGWTKGLGADLNAKIEELAKPTHVFEIIGPEERGWPTVP